MAQRLAGETALVTGSTSGLGAEIARLFAAESATVVVTGRDEARGEVVVAEIRAAGNRALFIAADISSASGCDALVTAVAETIGPPSVLVNNAASTGEYDDGPVGAIAPEDWDAMLRIDVSAVAWMCRAVVPHMTGEGGGAIVNISSRAAQHAPPAHAAYIAAKGAVEALTRSIAVDYARAGIRCNAVAPGYVVHDVRDADIELERRARLESMQLTRLTTATDVAQACLFLAGREAACITGVVLPVDGGSSAARAMRLG